MPDHHRPQALSADEAMLNAEEVRAHVRHWVDTTLSVPSPLFNNLPPCPYSREALLRNKVDIRCTTGADTLETLVETARTWDDRYELVLLAADPEAIAPDDLIAGVEALRAGFEADDLVVFFDHPRCTDPKYIVTSANGKYVFVGMQRLSLFLQAARPLFKRNYFEKAHKQFASVDHLDTRDKPRQP